MPQYVTGTCKKCQATVQMELNGKSVAELQEVLGLMQGFECPGRHVELSSALESFEWDWKPVWRDAPLSDEEFGVTLVEEHGCGRVFYLGNGTLGPKLGIKSLQSVAGLRHLGFGEFASDTHTYVRVDSPHGTRFYVRQPE